MKSEKIFINCTEKNRELAEQIREELLRQGIPVYLPSEQLNADGMIEIVEKMEHIAHDGGIMLVILSSGAVQGDLFVSNVQFMCEAAEERRVLLVYRVGEIEDDASIALYLSQSVMVRAGKEDTPDFSALIMQARRLLRMERSRSLIPKRMEKRTVSKIFFITAIAAFVLGIGWYVIRSSQTHTTEPDILIPTPIAMQIPLNTENIEQEMVVEKESRSFDFEVQGNPAIDAPFHFQPAFIQKTISFDDPQYDQSANSKDILNNVQGIADSGERMSLLQKDDVLQISYLVPEHSVNRETLSFRIKHLFALSDTSYIGMRFRIADYEGWADAEQPSTGFIIYCTLNDYCIDTIGFDLVQQQAFNGATEENIGDLGSDWHSLEMVLGEEENTLDFYLDGLYVRTETNVPSVHEYGYLEINFPFNVAADWIDFYVDEIVYGGEQALQLANSPEEALFYFEPDELLFVEDFNERPLKVSFNFGGECTELMDGSLAFNIPAGKDSPGGILMNTKTSPVSQVNYYAMRYKLDDNGPEYWSGWGALDMWFAPSKEINGVRYFGAAVERYSPVFSIKDALWGEMIFLEGSDENSPFDFWHTIELLLLPSPYDPEVMTIHLWHDGHFVLKWQIRSSEISEGTEDLYWLASLYAGSDAMHPFSGQIDLLRSGYISTGKVNE